MAEVPNHVIDKIKYLISEINILDVHIQQAILFGSYAKGNNTKWSDIDLALISDDFDGNRINDNQKIIEALVKADSSIEILPYRPEDFTPDNLFVKEILKHGIRII